MDYAHQVNGCGPAPLEPHLLEKTDGQGRLKCFARPSNIHRLKASTNKGKPRIVVVLITADGVFERCLRSIIAQKRDYPDLSLIVNHRAPERFSDHPIVQKYENCHRNRNDARARALETDAEYFLFLDDDIVLPGTALATLMQHNQEVVGGYYPILGTGKYVCGRWVADHTFCNFMCVQPGLVQTDTIGLGCALISRNVLEKVPFEAGVHLFCKDGCTGENMIVGECGMFGNRVADLGIRMYMCGEVVCQHLPRNYRTPNIGN
jgi:hypothetical protein